MSHLTLMIVVKIEQPYQNLIQTAGKELSEKQ
jgi:hypothetical protein